MNIAIVYDSSTGRTKNAAEAMATDLLGFSMISVGYAVFVSMPQLQ